MTVLGNLKKQKQKFSFFWKYRVSKKYKNCNLVKKHYGLTNIDTLYATLKKIINLDQFLALQTQKSLLQGVSKISQVSKFGVTTPNLLHMCCKMDDIHSQGKKWAKFVSWQCQKFKKPVLTFFLGHPVIHDFCDFKDKFYIVPIWGINLIYKTCM